MSDKVARLPSRSTHQDNRHVRNRSSRQPQLATGARRSLTHPSCPLLLSCIGEAREDKYHREEHGLAATQHPRAGSNPRDPPRAPSALLAPSSLLTSHPNRNGRVLRHRYPRPCRGDGADPSQLRYWQRIHQRQLHDCLSVSLAPYVVVLLVEDAVTNRFTDREQALLTYHRLHDRALSQFAHSNR